MPVGASAPARLAAIPDLPDPARLPRRQSWVPASTAGEGRPWPLAEHRLTVAVDDLPDPVPEGAGVGVFDGEGYACGWWPLPAPGDGTASLQLAFTAPQATPLRVVFAGSEAQARFGYWSRVDRAAGGGASGDGASGDAAPVRLAGSVQPVVVHAGHLDEAQRLLRLRRKDDADWVPFGAFTTPMRADARGDLALVLGPGTYLLEPWTGGGTQAFAIAVPGPREVTASFQP